MLSGYNELNVANVTTEAISAIASNPPQLIIYFEPYDDDAMDFCQIINMNYNIPILTIGDSLITTEASLPFPYKFQDFLQTVKQFVSPSSQNHPRIASQLEEATKYKDLFDRASDPILLIDYDSHIIIDANYQATRLYGYTQDELIGMSLLQIVPDEQHPSIQKNTRSLSKNRNVLRVKKRTHFKKDGTPFFVSISASLIEYGGRLVFQDIIRDETERLQFEEDLKRLNQLKDQFVSNVSHELQSPLASMEIRLHMLAKQPEKLERHSSVLQRELDRLSGLIKNLLMLSRLDQGQQELNFSQVDLNDLTQEFYTDRSLLAHENNLTLNYETSSEQVIVNGSRPLLGQVLSIFLTNAFHYTPAGGQVTISTRQTIINGETWVGFCVKDTGLGIPSAEHESLFTRFFRGRVGRESSNSGTGLGLAIAKEILEQHNGYIYIESEGIPGEGATFGIWLPIQNHA